MIIKNVLKILERDQRKNLVVIFFLVDGRDGRNKSLSDFGFIFLEMANKRRGGGIRRRSGNRLVRMLSLIGTPKFAD